MKPKDLSNLATTKLKFIEPMYARLVNESPQGQDWLYEVKFDGYRCLAGKDSTGVTLLSRRGNLFTKQFPQIAQACERLPPGTLFRRRDRRPGCQRADFFQPPPTSPLKGSGIAVLCVRRARMPWPKPVERATVGKAKDPE
jgi:ATP dependent DNA ligase domain